MIEWDKDHKIGKWQIGKWHGPGEFKESVKLSRTPFKPDPEIAERVIRNTKKIVADLKLRHDLPPERPKDRFTVFPNGIWGYMKDQETIEYCDKMLIQLKELIDLLDDATSDKNPTQKACFRGINLICEDMKKALNGE